MPWDITILADPARRNPLGNRDDVIAKFAAVFPGVTLQQPPVPSDEWLAMMPEILRENFLRPKLAADVVAGDVSIQFYAGGGPVIESLGVEVRGDGNPIPALAALCVPNGWIAMNTADDSVIDLSADGSPAWDRFREYRDRAIESLRNPGKAPG
jgi:hypothetical protein